MEPWQSWTLLGLVLGAVGYYYSTTAQNKRMKGRGAANLEPAQQVNSKSRNDGKVKRKKEKEASAPAQQSPDALESSTQLPASGIPEGAKKKKPRKKNAEKATSTAAVELSNEKETAQSDHEQEELDNIDFARQLNNAQVGTSLKKPDGPAQSKKGKKKANRKNPANVPNGNAPPVPNGVPNGTNVSGTSSTTGADADDDLSLANSPELAATSATTASGLDVSDMLEAPAKGPSILRLTEPAHPQPVREPKVKKAAPEPETKKQRQHRKKREEQKVIREEIEKERKVLLETQRRTAREAEGRPAKNGLASSPAANAWNGRPTAEAPPVKSSASTAQPLLDTLDQTESRTSSPEKHVNTLTTPQPSTYQDLPSEEEQLRIISELDSDNTWSTVEKGGKAKKKKAPAPQASMNSIDPGTVSDGSSIKGKDKGLGEHSSTRSEAPASKSHTTKDSDIETSKGRDEKGASTNVSITSKKLEAPPMDTAKVTEAAAKQTPPEPAMTVSNDESLTAKLDATKIDSATEPNDAQIALAPSTELTLAEESSEVPACPEDYDNEYADDEEAASDDDHENAEKVEHAAEAESSDGKINGRWAWQIYGEDHKKFIARNHEVRKTLDRSIWNHDNIHKHPDYNEAWPYALIGHPLDSDWADADSDWLRYVSSLMNILLSVLKSSYSGGLSKEEYEKEMAPIWAQRSKWFEEAYPDVKEKRKKRAEEDKIRVAKLDAERAADREKAEKESARKKLDAK